MDRRVPRLRLTVTSCRTSGAKNTSWPACGVGQCHYVALQAIGIWLVHGIGGIGAPANFSRIIPSGPPDLNS
jgi:hypothetical protein